MRIVHICEPCATRYRLPFREDWSAAVCYACDHYRAATDLREDVLDARAGAEIARAREAARIEELRRWNWITG